MVIVRTMRTKRTMGSLCLMATSQTGRETMNCQQALIPQGIWCVYTGCPLCMSNTVTNCVSRNGSCSNIPVYGGTTLDVKKLSYS